MTAQVLLRRDRGQRRIDKQVFWKTRPKQERTRKPSDACVLADGIRDGLNFSSPAAHFRGRIPATSAFVAGTLSASLRLGAQRRVAFRHANTSFDAIVETSTSIASRPHRDLCTSTRLHDFLPDRFPDQRRPTGILASIFPATTRVTQSSSVSVSHSKREVKIVSLGPTYT